MTDFMERLAPQTDAAGGRDITVAINTRNRAASLLVTLTSLLASVLPNPRLVELLVVDNGSTDHTRDVVEAFAWPNVKVRYLYVAEPGVARAKNCAVRASTGRALLFLDDDVLVPDCWLHEMSRQILGGEVDAVGGGIRIPSDRKPSWTTPTHEEWLASTEHWEATRHPALVGANMAIGRHVFETIGLFNEELQHGEDTLISNQILAAGLRLVHRHDVVVDHLLQPRRFTHAGFAAQAKRRAIWHAYEVHHWEHGHPSHPRIRGWQASARLVWHRMTHGGQTEPPDLDELRLMQDVAFWPAYLAVRDQPPRYPPR